MYKKEKKPWRFSHLGGVVSKTDDLFRRKFENKLQKKVAKESEKKVISINSKKTEYILIIKNGNHRCDFRNGDIKMKQVHKSKHLSTKDPTLDIEIGRASK